MAPTKRQLALLHALSFPKIDKRIVSAILKHEKDSLNLLSDCCYNALRGNIPLDSLKKNKLSRYKKEIRYLACPKASVKNKKKVVIQQGGFLQYLIPAALAVLSNIIN